MLFRSVLVRRGSSMAHGTHARVELVMLLVRLNQGLFYVIRTDMHHMGLNMINPDECVIVRHKALLAFNKSRDTVLQNATHFISTIDGLPDHHAPPPKKLRPLIATRPHLTRNQLMHINERRRGAVGWQAQSGAVHACCTKACRFLAVRSICREMLPQTRSHSA